ncbi:MAG: tRNA adenosine(34) deaminase TadA [Acidaminococcaceae bacterium]|jgi:tRNA(adenine34) deaminase|nr:tRNA adenosine(34) deaminase TadA [Acidaminococcaceae bacterium]
MLGGKDQEYMKIALKEAHLAAAEGEIPVGAVLVVDDAIIAMDHNRRERNKDATAHAEILVIQEACRRLQRWRLDDALLYVTLEPCPMCAGAIFNARIKRLVYGASDSKAGACGSLFNIVQNKYLNHRAEVTAGVMEAECGQVLKEFLNGKR